MKYTGKGFLPDVPARDLTEKESEHYGIEMLISSGCYEIEPEKEQKQKKEVNNGR